MTNISQEYFNKYRYSLRGPLGVKYISDPIGWDEDSKVFKRSTDAHGVFVSLSNDLQFYVGDRDNDGGYNYIKETYDTYGINVNVILVKEEDLEGAWLELYRGNLDFSTYQRLQHTIKIKFNESGVYEKIKARHAEPLELDRLDTMDGTVLPELSVEDLILEGRKILIVNRLTRTDGNGKTRIEVNNDLFLTNEKSVSVMEAHYGPANRWAAFALPLTAVAEQSGNVQSVWNYLINENGNSYFAQDEANMIYSIADYDIQLTIDIDINLSYNQTNLFEFVKVDLVTFKDGITYNYKSYDTLAIVEDVATAGFITFKISGKKVDLLEGESLGLVVNSKMVFPGGGTSGSATFSIFNSEVIITEDTHHDPTKSKFILAHEALERIISVITNKQGLLKSKALGRTDIGYSEDGYCSLTGLTNGFWVREFNTEKITSSFDDFMDSFNACWQLGYGIEKIGFEEFVRVEHISHFYKEIPTMKLGGAVNNITRTVAKDYFYSGIEIGYSKPSGATLYEEALGLDEYNILNKFTTAITRLENKFIKISKYRADSYGTEFARRKPRADFPEEDTRYDIDVMMLDLKRGDIEGHWKQRKWADDFVVPENFDKITTGIYAPDTATNLRYSPMNTLLRWGFWLKGGLMKNLTDYIRYTSSNGNSALSTKLDKPGAIEYSENGNVLNSDLHRNLFNPEIITFEFPVSNEMMKTVNGFIIVDGEKIMNYYGLVEFINEYGEYEYGFLLSLEPNAEGKWELLSSTKKKSNAPAAKEGWSYITGPTLVVISNPGD